MNECTFKPQTNAGKNREMVKNIMGQSQVEQYYDHQNDDLQAYQNYENLINQEYQMEPGHEQNLIDQYE